MMKGNNQSGFTLIELLISMAIAGLLLSLMVLAFTGQSRSYNTQQDISTLQGDMKAALQLMSRDIRMAGYDPRGTGTFSITGATSTSFSSTQDLDGLITVGPDETVAYSLNGTTSLRRSTDGGVTFQPVIDNITNLGFEYLVVTAGATSTSPETRTWTNFSTATANTSAPASSTDLANIRAVNICLQGRTSRQTSTTADTGSFMAAFHLSDGTPNPVDWTPVSAVKGNFQWRTMCIEVTCRNLQ